MSPMDSRKQPHADANEGLMFATETQNFISLYFSLISVNNNNNNNNKKSKAWDSKIFPDILRLSL